MLTKVKSFLKTNKKTLVISSLICTVLISGVGYYYQTIPSSQTVVPAEASEKVHKTVNPKKIKDEKKILIGKVLSHESARVFPRRSGIIEDILVDIGDQVKKGQVLAYMFPEGVESESSLEIETERSMMIRAADEYKNTKLVSAEKIKNLEEKLNQEMIRLDRLKADNLKNGSEQVDVDSLLLKSEELQLEYEQLELLETDLTEQKKLQEINKLDAENGLVHAQNNYFASFDYVLQIVLAIFDGSDAYHGGTYGLGFTVEDLSPSLGVFNQENRVATISDVNKFIKDFNDLSQQSDIAEYYALQSKAQTMLLGLQELLRSSGPGTSLDLHKLSSDIVMAQDRLYKAQEKFENAVDVYNVVNAKEEKTILVQKEKVDQQKAKIALLESRWQQNATELESKILIAESGINRLKQEIQLEKAMNQKSIDMSRNQYNIANTKYLKTATEKGHVEIIAPFTGVIAKRSVEVGELAMTSMAAFDLVDVQTSLSKKAKNEIQFGVPEDLQDVVAIGDTIKFYLPEDDLTVYEAEVTRKSPQIDEELHTITVQAKLPDDLRFPHHTSVQVELVTGEKDTYQVDSSVLKREDDKNYVWVLNGEDVEKLYVTVIEEDGEFAEIAGDLNVETQVVTNYYGKK